MPDLPAAAVAVAALAVAGLALLLALGAHLRFERLRRRLLVLQGGADEASLLEVLSGAASDVAALRSGLDATRAELAATRAELGRAPRHVSVVRYDALGAGGHLSFSAALLDDAGDGLVLTSIAGRTESRTYAKRVSGGRGETDLSPEERQAVEAARRG